MYTYIIKNKMQKIKKRLQTKITFANCISVLMEFYFKIHNFQKAVSKLVEKDFRFFRNIWPKSSYYLI